MNKLKINSFIKTECGRIKYDQLSNKTGHFAKLRLFWFILVATIRDLNITSQDSSQDSNS